MENKNKIDKGITLMIMGIIIITSGILLYKVYPYEQTIGKCFDSFQNEILNQECLVDEESILKHTFTILSSSGFFLFTLGIIKYMEDL